MLANTPGTHTPDTELSHGAFRLLRVLRQARSYTDSRGRVLRRVGQGYLAARCGHVSKRTVRRYLGELQAGGRLVKVPHRRSRAGGRWVSLECQAYALSETVSAGHTKRTPMSGPPFRGSTRGPAGARPKPPPAPNPPDLPDTCGHGYPAPRLCPLCRRGIPAYDHH